MELGEIIREVRERTGLSRAEFSRRIGYEVSFIYRLEHGLRGPSLSVVLAIDPLLTKDERMRMLRALGFDIQLHPVTLDVEQALERDTWSPEQKRTFGSAVRTMLRSSSSALTK